MTGGVRVLRLDGPSRGSDDGRRRNLSPGRPQLRGRSLQSRLRLAWTSPAAGAMIAGDSPRFAGRPQSRGQKEWRRGWGQASKCARCVSSGWRWYLLWGSDAASCSFLGSRPDQLHLKSRTPVPLVVHDYFTDPAEFVRAKMPE